MLAIPDKVLLPIQIAVSIELLKRSWRVTTQQLQYVSSPQIPAMRFAGPRFLLWGTVGAQSGPPAGEGGKQGGPCPLLQEVDYTAESAALVTPHPLLSVH